MKLKNKHIGFAVTGSHCTLERVIPVLKEIADREARIYPVLSEAVRERDTKFGPASKWVEQITEITDQPVIKSIVEAEPIGPGKLLDLLIIAPCTGNTMAKLAGGVIDQTVGMAAKAQLRNSRPVLLAIATNDALGLNARNLSILLNTENIYFVPFGQDNPVEKPNSLVARMDLIPDTAELALEGKQIQPVIIEYKGI